MTPETIARTRATDRDHAAYYRSLTPEGRASAAREMLTEQEQHYNRLNSLIMTLAQHLRGTADTAEDDTALNLAEIADAWINDSDHIAQSERLRICLQVAEEVSHV
jgi:hypothetical protein